MFSHNTKKDPDLERPGSEKRAGVVLLSHRDSPAIPSPQASLTSVFGMGTGVASLL